MMAAANTHEIVRFISFDCGIVHLGVCLGCMNTTTFELTDFMCNVYNIDGGTHIKTVQNLHTLLTKFPIASDTKVYIEDQMSVNTDCMMCYAAIVMYYLEHNVEVIGIYSGKKNTFAFAPECAYSEMVKKAHSTRDAAKKHAIANFEYMMNKQHIDIKHIAKKDREHVADAFCQVVATLWH